MREKSLNKLQPGSMISQYGCHGIGSRQPAASEQGMLCGRCTEAVRLPGSRAQASACASAGSAAARSTEFTGASLLTARPRGHKLPRAADSGGTARLSGVIPLVAPVGASGKQAQGTMEPKVAVSACSVGTLLVACPTAGCRILCHARGPRTRGGRPAGKQAVEPGRQRICSWPAVCRSPTSHGPARRPC